LGSAASQFTIDDLQWRFAVTQLGLEGVQKHFDPLQAGFVLTQRHYIRKQDNLIPEHEYSVKLFYKHGGLRQINDPIPHKLKIRIK